MISNMYDLSGQAVLSTKGYRLELWRMRRNDIREKTSWSEGAVKLTGKQRESKNHVTVKVLNSYKITNLRRRDESK